MAYRSLISALDGRRQSLETERRELDARLSDLERASERRAEVDRELADVERAAQDAADPRRLPVLNRVRVASPCKARWEDMAGDERVRFCGQCQKNVYDLSAMTSDEAEALIYEHEGRLCARFFRRQDGTILTSDCTLGVRRRRHRALAVFGLAAAAATACSVAAGGAMTQGEVEVVGAIHPIDTAPVQPAKLRQSPRMR